MSATARDPLIDALRALALVGVLVVNLYSYPISPMRMAVLDVDAAAGGFDRLLDGLVGGLLLAKAYPVLTFLFGYSLVLADQRDRAAHRAGSTHKRLKRLVLLGVLHGALLYFGDILLPYAVAGWFCARLLRRRLRRVVRHAQVWGIAAVFLTIAMLPWPGSWWAAATAAQATMPIDPLLAPSFAQASSWASFWGLNLLAWTSAVFAQLVMTLPQLVVLMLAGVIAARLRLLTHARWRTWLAQAARRWLPWALAANAALALALVLPALQAHGLNAWAGALTWPVGPALGLAALAWMAAHRDTLPQRAMHGLAALGRRTLTLYLTHSLLAVLLLSGAGLGLPLGRVGLLALALLLWALAFVWAQFAEQRGWRGPAERWMARA